MSRYDSRSTDPTSYRDRRSDYGAPSCEYGVGGRTKREYGDNFHFGNPSFKWGAKLCSGDLHPDAIVHHERRFKTNKKEFYSELQQYHDSMIRNLQKVKERCARSKDPEAEILQMTSRIRKSETEKIEEAAERGELDELVLMVIWNRLDLARRDEEKDANRILDLLYRRVETEILKREATPAMRLLNDLLNLHDGFNDDGWLKECKKRMVETFPREDPFSILVPMGFDINKGIGCIGSAACMLQSSIFNLVQTPLDHSPDWYGT